MRLGHRDAPGAPDRGRSPRDGESGPGRDRVVPRGIGVLLQAQNLRSSYGEMEILRSVAQTSDERCGMPGAGDGDDRDVPEAPVETPRSRGESQRRGTADGRAREIDDA